MSRSLLPVISSPAPWPTEAEPPLPRYSSRREARVQARVKRNGAFSFIEIDTIMKEHPDSSFCALSKTPTKPPDFYCLGEVTNP